MGSWSRDTSWRQGCLLQSETIRELELAPHLPPEKVAAVIASHDCDLAQLPDSEPFVEVVLGAFLDGAPNGNYTNCKNLRRLHVGFSATGEEVHVEIDTNRRVLIPKDAADNPRHGLSEHLPSPSHKMTAKEHGIFQRWLAARYRRSAFPDEFDRRLKEETKVAERLAKALKDSGNHIVAVFFDVDGGTENTRNGADDPYELVITLLYATDVDPDIAWRAAVEAAETIQSIFDKRCRIKTGDHDTWKWIELVDIEIVSDEALSYAQSQLLKKWQADHISLRTDPEQPMLED
ncbi:hypothetical protein [Stutzerimonas stutzeri]|uniref:Uncharacterized protein n=1 Tax=Stutzerimonas stutzeri KOS6 TaxID=1218352 RepID=A0A061JJZ5_STUST|nr:hypothetical protein [Stutzerimonas stutzeri]EWC39742.1 hypothetical protein B597_018485 [Stutzerimonas stutzeri KOS6]